MMKMVVFENVSYFMSCDNDVITEGIEGCRIEEDEKGKLFVVFPYLSNGKENERKFSLPEESLGVFPALEKKYRDFFEKQRKLEEVTEKIKNRDRDDLMKVCQEAYQDHRADFIAMRMGQKQFFDSIKERVALSC